MSPFAIAWRSTFERFFKSTAIPMATLAILLAVRHIGREEAMNDLWVLIYGPVAVVIVAVCWFFAKWITQAIRNRPFVAGKLIKWDEQLPESLRYLRERD